MFSPTYLLIGLAFVHFGVYLGLLVLLEDVISSVVSTTYEMNDFGQ